jgi:hypothetical protein
LEGSYVEDVIAELGMYDADEDLSGWTFERLYHDWQWQEPDLTLEPESQPFTGPLSGAVNRGDGRGYSCDTYFKRLWPDEVLDRIIAETNR